jgi:hypothetical protein
LRTSTSNRWKALGGAIALALSLWASRGVAQGDPDQALRVLAHINNPGELEPAGSHGSIGMAIAAGAASYSIPEDNPALATRLGVDSGVYAVPRVWITKGLPWPVDLGIEAASATDGAFTQATGYAQWTVYEALARPAVAVRASYGKLMGLAGADVRSTGAAAVASYGFLRYFTLYASGSLTRHQGTLAAADGSSARLAETWFEPTRTGGLKVTVLPPFVAATAELAAGPDNRREYAAKVSVGM